MSEQRCINCGKKVQWIVLGVNLALFAVKISFALLSNSKSLLADGYESLANSIITIVVLVSLHLAARNADERFPYGYGKVEFLAAGIVNTMLMMAAMAFIVISFREMMMPGPDKTPGLIAVVAAVISIIANQAVFGYGRCAGEKLESPAIMANAMANRADVGTSAAVIIAVVGANMGLSKLDHVVAVLIGVLIMKVTLDGVRKAIKGLMDVSIHSEEMRIKNLTEGIEGVCRIEDVRTRLVGRKLWIDMKVALQDDWILSKGLKTAGKIKDILHRKMKNVSEVSVQLVPCKGVDEVSTTPPKGEGIQRYS